MNSHELNLALKQTKVVILATTNKGGICLHSSQGEPAVPADETLPGFHPPDFTCETSHGCMCCSKAKFEARDSFSVSSVILVYFIWPSIWENKREVFRREWNEEAGRATIFLQTETPTVLESSTAACVNRSNMIQKALCQLFATAAANWGGKQDLISSTTELGSAWAGGG